MIADVLIKNASELITARGVKDKPKTKRGMNNLGIIRNGALAIEDKKIIAVGETKEILAKISRAETIIDAGNKVVMPGFVDCHTHLVFGGSREEEFVLKIKGAKYLEILKKGGGILSTVEKTREDLAFPRTLIDRAQIFLEKMLAYGTTTVEIKSGYGLSEETELSSLNIIGRLKRFQPIDPFNKLRVNPEPVERIDIVPTFLGAHALPNEYQNQKDDYLRLILRMLDEIKKRNLAEYCDVFCEKGAFSVEDCRQVLEKAKSLGMKLKLHADEFYDVGGVELGVELDATSIDHLDVITEKGIKLMSEKGVMAVLLPGVPFHLMTGVYAPARKMIEAGIPIALATDFNPGSCPTLSMQMIIALACREMKMTPAEAITAATINAAYALDRGDKIGSLEVGKQADVIILDIPNHRQLPYWFGMNSVERVIKKGKIVR